MTNNKDNKELVKIEKEVLSVSRAAIEYSIENVADLERGADLLHQLKEIETKLISRKQEVTRPMMEALASVRELFKPLETAYSEAKKMIKDKMLKYQESQIIDTSVEGTVGSTHTRSLQKLEIVDEKKIPREYLTPDREKIFTALKNKIKVPGAKIRLDKILAIK